MALRLEAGAAKRQDRPCASSSGAGGLKTLRTETRRRRRLLAAGVLTAAAGLAALVLSSTGGAGRTTVDPASWKPWHLTSASQFRLPPPAAAKSAATKRELAQLLRFQKTQTPQRLQAIKKWDDQIAAVPWTDVLLQAFQSYRPRPPAAAYALAIFYTGLYDAMVAACDSRNAYASMTRPAPGKLDPRIKPAVKATSGSTYASPEAAMAGAAEILIPYLFPDAPVAIYRQAANEAVASRLWAGLNYRSDVEQGRLLGQKVARLVIDQQKTDGRATNTGFPNVKPAGDGYWSPTPPAFEPPFGGPAGTWRPWLMTAIDQFVGSLPGPSQYGSQAFMDQLMATLNTVNNETQAQRDIAFFWDDGPGTFTPPGHWISIAEGLIKQQRVSNEQALRELALQSAAEADAGVEAWRIKYTYWSVRPITAIWRLCDGGQTLCSEDAVRADPSRAPYRSKWYSPITTPAFPSYPSGHAAFSGAASSVIASFFPAAAAKVTALAEQAAQSRQYAGIHYPEDNRDGLVLGRMIGQLAIERAKSDGAQ
jgi:hypothetical protein